MAYLNKIKILDQNGQISGDSPFGFGIGMLREQDGSIVYDGDDGEQKILLAKGTTEGTYTLEGTVLQQYIDQRDTFLKDVKYDSTNKKIVFTFTVGNGEIEDGVENDTDPREEIINIPVNDFAVDADNIYFTEDFKVTTALGYFEPEASGYKNVEAKGKSVQSLFIEAFQKEDTALEGIEYPSATFTFSGIGAYEVGTEVTPSVRVASFSEGSYPYGTEQQRKTGVRPSSITAAIGKTQKTYDYTTGSQSWGSAIKVTDDYSQTISAYVSYGDATNSPRSNIGNSQTEKKISAGKTDTVTSSAITGYRNFWYGFITELKETNNMISRDSQGIVKFNEIPLTAGNQAVPKGYLPNCDANKGLQNPSGQNSVAFVILTPNTANTQISSIVSLGALNTTVPSTDYEKVSQIGTIAGANGSSAVQYDLLYYKPDNIPSGMTLTIQLT